MTFCVFCICFYLNIVRVVLFLFFSFFGGIKSEKTVNYNISEAGFSSPPLQPPPFVWSLTSSPRGFGFYAQGDTCFHSFCSLIFIYLFPIRLQWTAAGKPIHTRFWSASVYVVLFVQLKRFSDRKYVNIGGKHNTHTTEFSCWAYISGEFQITIISRERRRRTRSTRNRSRIREKTAVIVHSVYFFTQAYEIFPE